MSEATEDPVARLSAIASVAKWSWARHDAERVERMRTNPNNGKLGWWRVIGIRHSAIAKASSALEAVEKSKGFVDSWESPEAFWIGEELPEVFSA